MVVLAGLAGCAPGAPGRGDAGLGRPGGRARRGEVVVYINNDVHQALVEDFGGAFRR
ncbi:hypothetical protein ACRAWD_30890 [Caulobacter segnis]